MDSMWIPYGVHEESMWSPCGVLWGPPHIQPKKRNYVDSTWSPVEFMRSCGVHEESMGQGKVHQFLTALKEQASFMPFNSPLYHIGTREVAFAVDQYLFSPGVDTLYASENHNVL